ncbi:hypothetical protein VB716_10860 [Synechococcus sp. CCY9201]|uniref:hypothetical protein n=1 Tax=Synechococcus sp. CBW1107 TaxID=2789857 RepID=UPI002AD35EC8|nr:hypothetical protein [Synechococcus sp. CBW1107]MEA5474720.1 hypothetical protein [Synechococcus sp. CCY9201]
MHQRRDGHRLAADFLVVEHHLLGQSRIHHPPGHIGRGLRVGMSDLIAVAQHERGEDAGEHGVRPDVLGPQVWVGRTVEIEEAG